MNTFNSYEKMPEGLHKLKLSEDQMKQLNKLKWVVTEKVHGANFNIHYENDQLRYGKRKEFLNWSDDFFGFQLVVEPLEFPLRKLFQTIAVNHDYDRCTIYGELFGGAYPHAEVTADKRVQAIQTGIYYCPGISFYAFDIAIEKDGNRKYIAYEEVMNYLQEAGILFAKPLLVGSLTDALNYDIAFQSTIPSQLGLPSLEQDNLAEGVVIKPLTDCSLKNNKDIVRPILKIKNEKFSEEDKFHQARQWSFVPEKPPTEEELAFLLPDLQAFVTENRLRNVISKTGHLRKDDEERLAQVKTMFLDDVFETFNESFDELLSCLTEKDLNWLKQRLMLDIEKLLQNQTVME